jgi:hypothetical protein
VSDPKQTNIWALLAKLEGSYNGGGALAAATDGQWLLEEFAANITYVHDGKRINQAPGTGNTFKRLKPTGLIMDGTPKFEGRGAGVAYSASVFPPDVHVFLRASGHSFVTDTTGGAEKQTYSPQSLNDSTWSSLVCEGYARNQKYPFQALYCDMGFTVDGNGPMVFEFPFKAIGTVPTDVAPPAPTYQALTVTPPKAESAVLSFNGVSSLVVRKVSFKKNQVVAGPRINQQSPSIGGFAMGSRNPVFEVEVEAVALSTLNPYSLNDLATPIVITYQIGAAAVYNRIKFTANQAQVIDVKDGKDGPTAIWTITSELKPSSPILSDDYSLAFVNT